jgi:hypothetical protein
MYFYIQLPGGPFFMQQRQSKRFFISFAPHRNIFPAGLQPAAHEQMVHKGSRSIPPEIIVWSVTPPGPAHKDAAASCDVETILAFCSTPAVGR